MALQSDVSQKQIFNTLDSLRDVPTLPAIAMRAVAISNNDDSSARELADFISRDQALTTKVLGLVNAASYGVSGKVSTVARAIIIMGFARVRNVILASATANIFSGKSDCLDRNRVWLHSVATATAARLLAKSQVGLDAETAYVAGLLHEVGIVILDRFFHEALRTAMQQAYSRQTTIDAMLRETLTVDQFKVGGYLARRWQLPSVLQNSILLHNQPSTQDVDSKAIAVVHVASMIADACKMNYEPYAARKPIAASAIALLNITPVNIKNVADELNKQRQSIEEFAILCGS